MKKESVLPRGKMNQNDKECIAYAKHMAKLFTEQNCSLIILVVITKCLPFIGVFYQKQSLHTSM
jgi:hypothetical protein